MAAPFKKGQRVVVVDGYYAGKHGYVIAAPYNLARTYDRETGMMSAQRQRVYSIVYVEFETPYVIPGTFVQVYNAALKVDEVQDESEYAAARYAASQSA